jgi:hypothetical protein
MLCLKSRLLSLDVAFCRLAWKCYLTTIFMCALNRLEHIRTLLRLALSTKVLFEKPAISMYEQP